MNPEELNKKCRDYMLSLGVKTPAEGIEKLRQMEDMKNEERRFEPISEKES